jgi:oligopeptide transport system ATP-binding protein
MATTLPETSDLGLPEGGDAPSGPLLEVVDLHVEFRTRDAVVNAVNGITYTLSAGETLAILGESGSGKSVSAQAVMGILDSPPAFITQGDIRFRGEDMLAMPEEQRRKIRGRRIAMIFQDALSALNPVFTVGDQIGEMFRVHMGMSKKESLARTAELMDRVHIPSATQRINDYPHQFSGGMRQRVMIAMAMSLDPDIIIADEPTTALDVTVQAQVMGLLAELQEEAQMGLILITHDLGVIADVADRIAVMYAGRIIEQAPVYDIYARPAHPYTEGLLQSIPRVDLKGQDLFAIKGLPPSLMRIPPGCAFHPRCPYRRDVCREEVPALFRVNADRGGACFFWKDVVEGAPKH